jgi:peptide/nickel transport system ATP-binding protein
MGLLPRRACGSLDRFIFKGEAIDIHGERLRELRGDRMAMIFQEPMTALNPCLTIGEQMTEGFREHRSARPAEARERAISLLERVGILGAPQRLRQYPHQLSGGLRQRVMIAMALMCGPDLLIADEPTTALDVTVQAQILALIKDLQSEFQMGLMLITHDLGVVARVANRVCVMYAGEVVETGTVNEIFSAPRHPYTQGLLACVPVLGRARGEPLGVIPGTVPSLVGDAQGCAFFERCGVSTPACRVPGPQNVCLGPGRYARCTKVEQHAFAS